MGGGVWGEQESWLPGERAHVSWEPKQFSQPGLRGVVENVAGGQNIGFQ